MGDESEQADVDRLVLPRLRVAFWLLVLLVIPTLITMTLLSRPQARKAAIALQNKCLIAAIIVGAVATADSWWNRKRRATTFALLTAGSCGLLIALIVWNKLLLRYIARTGFTKNTFRSVFHTIYAPIYGRVQFARPSWWIVVMVVAALLLLWEISRSRPAIWRIAIAQLALTITFAGTESLLRINSYYAEFRPFELDLEKFGGFGDLMTHYVERMPELSHFESHYPPGFLLIFMLGRVVGTKLLAKYTAILLAVLTLVPLRQLARELGLSERAATLASTLFATSAGILIFPTITPIAATAFFSCLCLWLFVKALHNRDWHWGVAFGLAYAIYFFFSFASYMPGLVMGLFLLISLINRSVSLRRAALVMGISIVSFIFFFLSLRLFFGFNIIACFKMASAMHLKDPGHGFDDPIRYLLRSTGGIIAYLISTSFAVAILGIAAAKRAPMNRAFVLATLLGILFSGFSGMSFLETERIWVMFTPALAVAAAVELEQREQREGKWTILGVILFALVFSCAWELVFRHHLAGVAPQPERPPAARKEKLALAPPDGAPALRCNHIPRTPRVLRQSHRGIWNGDAHPAPSPAQNIPPSTAVLPPAGLHRSTPQPIESLRRCGFARRSCCGGIRPPRPILAPGFDLQLHGAGPSLSLA